MPAARDDYLFRLVTQVNVTLQYLREKLKNEIDVREIPAETRAAVALLLGPQRTLLERLDPISARQIVGNADVVKTWTALLLLEADAEKELGNDGAAAILRARAVALSAQQLAN